MQATSLRAQQSALICRPRTAPLAAPARHAIGQYGGCSGHVARAQPKPQYSFDGEEELDDSLSQELARLRPREQFQQAAKHMDLVWRVGRNRTKTRVCTCCKGTKEMECKWCHGTGAMMIGDTMFPSTDSKRSVCPVCNGKGYIPCEECRGTGFKAGWLEDNGSQEQPQQ